MAAEAVLRILEGCGRYRSIVPARSAVVDEKSGCNHDRLAEFMPNAVIGYCELGSRLWD